jgi:hypothetical protein
LTTVEASSELTEPVATMPAISQRLTVRSPATAIPTTRAAGVEGSTM